MQALIYGSGLIGLVMGLVIAHAWASNRGQRLAKHGEETAKAESVENLKTEREHQRRVAHLGALAQVEILQRAIPHTKGDPVVANLIGEALAQQVEVLQWVGSSSSDETLELVPTPLLPLLRRLVLTLEKNADVDCIGLDAWVNLLTVAPRGKLAQAIGHLLAQVSAASGKIEIETAVEGRQAVLTLRSYRISPNVYASFATAMARNWIVASGGELSAENGAHKIVLPFIREDEVSGSGHFRALTLPAREMAN